MAEYIAKGDNRFRSLVRLVSGKKKKKMKMFPAIFFVYFLISRLKLGYTNDLKIYLKRYDRLYLFYYSIESSSSSSSLGIPYLTSVSSHPSKDNHAIWHVEHPISNKNHV
jgi:hypothetical protein